MKTIDDSSVSIRRLRSTFHRESGSVSVAVDELGSIGSWLRRAAIDDICGGFLVRDASVIRLPALCQNGNNGVDVVDEEEMTAGYRQTRGGRASRWERIQIYAETRFPSDPVTA